jgi:WXXGXW repeat (2 copies)
MSITRSIRSSLFALALLAISAAAFAQFSVSVSFAPPELPVYEQPLCPGDGYLWTPGYWAYAGDDDGYYWVPGTWVMAPEPGLLWTPAYWSWGGNGYVFNNGYWGEQVGFYGGVSYGYGYYGDGYQGGRWQNGQFYYNRSVSNVNVTNIHNVYNTTVINNTTTINRVSYNGGNGGISARPTPQQESAVHERHIPPVAAQTQHEQAARTNPDQRASVNHGTPTVAATPKPGEFSDRAVVHAKATGTPYVAPVRAAVQPPVNAPVAHPENAGRSDQPAANNQPKSDRTPSARPNRPEPSKPEPSRQPTAQPERAAEPNRPPVAQPNNRPESKRVEPTQRPLTAPPSERAQPQRAPASEPRAQQQQHAPSVPNKPEAKKSQEEKPKQNEKPE